MSGQRFESCADAAEAVAAIKYVQNPGESRDFF